MPKELPTEKFYHLINHGPCVIISSGDKKQTNIAPIAWLMPLNDEPPLAAVALSESHYTTELIDKHGTFVINLPDRKLLSSLLGAGKVSGRKDDKIKKFGVRLEDGAKVSTPHLKESIGWIECEVLDRKSYDGVILFVGKVLYCAVDESSYVEGEGLDLSKRPTVHHLGGKWFGVMDKKISL